MGDPLKQFRRPGYGKAIPGAPKSTYGDGKAIPGAPSRKPLPKMKPGVKGSAVLGVPDPGFVRLPGQKVVQSHGLPVGQLNVGAWRSVLRRAGYDIPATGSDVGSRMKSALADYLNPKHVDPNSALAKVLGKTRVTGNRDPHIWNQHFGSPATHDKVSLGPSKGLDHNGNPANVDTGPTGGKVNLSSLQRISAAVGTPLPTALASKIASEEAGAQFDPQIHDVQALLGQAPIQSAQDQADIKNWFGQIGDALGVARNRDSEATKSGVSSMKDAVAAIAASLGGGANQGAGDVASMGANDVGTLQALGTSQDMLNNDMAPIIANERAGAASNQLNKDALAKTQLQQQLEDLQGQRGQVLGSTKNNLLMQILGQNNTLAQQAFNNRLAVQQAGEAAQLNGLKALYYGSKAQQAQAGSSRGSLAYATPTEINGAQNAILSHILDPNGQPLPGMTPAKAASIARTVGGTYFPNGGVSANWAQALVSPYFGG